MSVDRARRRFKEWWSLGTWESCGPTPEAMSRRIKEDADGRACPVALCDHVMVHKKGELFGHECPDAATDDHKLAQALGGVNEDWCVEALCNECNRILGQILNEDYLQEYGGVSKVPVRLLEEFVDFQYRISSKSFREEDYPVLSRRFKQKKGWGSQTQLTENEMSESQSLASSLISEVSNETEEVVS